MKDYIKIIADSLGNGEPVVLFSVGGDTMNILRSLKRRFGLLPSALCDNDQSKQDHTFQGLYGLGILSPRNALRRYPSAFWFISTLDYKYQIIGNLLYDLRVPHKKIINYEPVIKKRGCAYVEKSFICDENRSFSFCWYQPDELPTVPFNCNYSKSIGDFISLREKTARIFETDQKHPCQNCCFLCEDYFPVKRKIRWINYGVGGVCNFDCIYCKSNARTARALDEQVPRLPDLIEVLNEHRLLAEDYGINIAPGEPTVHPQRERLFSAMNSYSNVINTNLAVFDTSLYKLMAGSFTKLVVSVDSGTRDTFKKIKGRDRFEMICENLKRYSTAGDGIIVLKYVFMPGVNDNEQDVDGFTELCASAGVSIGNISYDYDAEKPIPEKATKMMHRIKNNLDRLGIMCTQNFVYSSSDYVDALKKAICK